MFVESSVAVVEGPVARFSLIGGGGELGKLKTETYGFNYLHNIKLKHAI